MRLRRETIESEKSETKSLVIAQLANILKRNHQVEGFKTREKDAIIEGWRERSSVKREMA